MTRLRPELLDELLSDYETPEDLLGDEGLFKQLKKALLERALGAELSDHLGYEKGDPAGRGSGNSRNGHSGKTVLTEDGSVELAVQAEQVPTPASVRITPRLTAWAHRPLPRAGRRRPRGGRVAPRAGPSHAGRNVSEP